MPPGGSATAGSPSGSASTIPARGGLYERLGYIGWGHRHTVTSWREQRPDSAPVTVTETIDMLVKRL